jgi:phosphoribosylformylglycinamidine cyclo-ligase
MWRVFNMGLGFACVVAPESADVALKAVERGGTPGFLAGKVVEGEGVTLR